MFLAFVLFGGPASAIEQQELWTDEGSKNCSNVEVRGASNLVLLQTQTMTSKIEVTGKIAPASLTVPLPPTSFTHEAYEAYIADLGQALAAPAHEYDAVNVPGMVSGLAMAQGSFPGLKKQIEAIVDSELPGDFYETGTWRGGTSIFMVATLRAYEHLPGKKDLNRQFYGFDSFAGFPQVEDSKSNEYLQKALYAAPIDKVKASFEKFGILDDRVHFVKGFFEQTIPTFMPPQPIALLRMDGDLYSSTQVVLEHLYPHVQKNGWTVIDDYNWRPQAMSQTKKLCREAVDEYRAAHQITSSMVMMAGIPAWQKE